MATETVTVGVVLERRKPVSQWVDVLWVPVAVLPSAPGVADWTSLGVTDTGERFYAGAFEMGLFRTDTTTYRENLASGDPRVWVAARLTGGKPPVAVVGVTADPAEGESYTEAGDDIVENVPMAPDLAALLMDFVVEHHVERAFVKRKRRRWASDEDADIS
jgi:hypothetical protein